MAGTERRIRLQRYEHEGEAKDGKPSSLKERGRVKGGREGFRVFLRSC